MADASIEAKIGANVEGFRRGANEAKEHVDSLISGLRDFKAEQVSQARTARFFVSELLEIVPAADGAKGAIQGLIGIALSGGGMAAAFEAALFVAKQLGAVWHDNGDIVKKATADAVKAINDLDEKVKAYIASTTKETEAEKLRRETIRPLEEEAKRQRAALIALTDKQAEAQDKLNRLTQAHVVTRPIELGPLAAQIREATTALTLLEAKLASANVEQERILGADKVAEGKKNAADYAEAWGKAADEIYANDEKLLNTLAANAKANSDQIKAAHEKDIQEYVRMADEIYAEDERKLKELEASNTRVAKEILRAHLDAAKTIGAGFGTAFAGIVTGTMSVEKAFASMAKATIKAILDMVMKSIEAYALQAAAAAAAANAGIPGVGVFVAMAAAAAMEAAIMALIDSLPSAAVGMPHVPQDMPVMVHRNEAILTSSQADDWRGGQGGGGDIHLHFPNALVVDGQSMRRLFNDPHYVREFRDAQRRGRL